MLALRLEWAEPKSEFGALGTGRGAYENGGVLRNLRGGKVVATFLQREEE